jgi:hypothetical protein
MEKQPRGRPKGKTFLKAKTLLLTDEDWAKLNGLAGRWGCSGAAAVRRLIREAQEAAVEPSDRSSSESRFHSHLNHGCASMAATSRSG